jgi:16S rRNA (adenine1518-N6/adenine1519-N6)-dimethyltransferase
MSELLDMPAEVLRRHGLKAKHSWGQNFLGDADWLLRIVQAVKPDPGERVLELGAGLGHLTRRLLDAGASVVAVERDRDLAAILRRHDWKGLEVVEADAARIQFAEVAGSNRLAVVGNLPYHLSSSILFQVLRQQASVSRAVFTLQKEVVDRLASQPGGREYGLLPALLGLYFELDCVGVLGRHLFHPPPKVDSAVIRLTALSKPRAEVTSVEAFIRVVKAAFAQRRKTLSNSLKSDAALGGADKIAQALAKSGIDGQRRAETLTSSEFAQLERALSDA